MDWLELATRLGAPSFFIFLAARWFTSHAWPFVTRAWQEQQEERREERRVFKESLEALRIEMSEITLADRKERLETRDRFLSALEGHRQQLEQMAYTQAAMTKTQIDMQELLESSGKK